jgi:hypothetical protein
VADEEYPLSRPSFFNPSWATLATLAVAIICSALSLCFCWQIHQQVQQVSNDLTTVKNQLQTSNRLEIVEQNGVFQIDATNRAQHGPGPQVFFPKPYAAPPAIKVEAGPGFLPHEYQAAMKGFEISQVQPDYFRWNVDIGLGGGRVRLGKVNWKARGLMVKKGKPAQ